MFESEANELNPKMLIWVVVEVKLLFNSDSRKEIASGEPGVSLRSAESCDPRVALCLSCILFRVLYGA